jgi:ribose/xylose/arabinose/galactoside ABC-type transport system permease subunit
MKKKVVDKDMKSDSTSPKESIPRRVLLLLLRFRTFIVLILLTAIFSYLSPVYLSPNNLISMSKHVAINAILAFGMTLVIITAGIDLSVGSIVGLTAMLAGGLITEGLVLPMFGIAVFFRIWVIIIVGLLVGMICGLINGIFISRFKVTPFIATLGMLYAARGLALIRSNGMTFPNLGGNPDLNNTGFLFLGGSRFIGIPVPIWMMILFTLVILFIVKKTPFGRHIFAVGGNEHAAELAGIAVNRIRLLVYVISGFCAAMAGLIIASELGAAHPNLGSGYELNAIAAVVLGGTSMSGGRGTILGTIIGAFIIGFLGDGLIMLGVSNFWQQVIKGAVIVIAVIIDQAQEKLQRTQSLQGAERRLRA